MSLILWYKIEIAEADGGGIGGLAGAVASLLGASLPLKVSNDPFSGQYILDADVTLTMPSGPAASTFDLTLTNLPQDAADLLKSKHAAALGSHKPLHAKVWLGYFEDAPTFSPPPPVMEGAITQVRSDVDASGALVTHVRGQELGGYALRTKTKIAYHQQGPASVASFLQLVLHDTVDTGVALAPGHALSGQLTDYTLRAENGLAAVGLLADLEQAPVVIRDNAVFIKKAVGGGAPVTFSPDRDIVQLDNGTESDEDPDESQQQPPNGRLQTRAQPSLSLTVLGNPALRTGMAAKLDLPTAPPGSLRIHHLVHRFSVTSGYTCELILLAAEPGQLARVPVGAHGVVQRIRDLAETAQTQHAAIDVGEVTAYEPGSAQKHLATLNYGQSPASDVVAPSVATPVDDTTQLHSKPIASLFAFHHCGLVVPVYPKMRAVLAHNRGLANDSIVAGFLWSEQPSLAPPPNQPGDYWLCLPTQLGADKLPTGKTVNDLTDASGLRLIQAKGLHIMVGEDLLPAVGARPPVDNSLNGQVVIEHKSGTKITIADDGTVNVETTGSKLSLTNGSVTLTLDGSTVKVS
jgi:hypothetical protein